MTSPPDAALLLAALRAQLRRGSLVFDERELRCAEPGDAVSVQAHAGARGATLYEFRIERGHGTKRHDRPSGAARPATGAAR